MVKTSFSGLAGCMAVGMRGRAGQLVHGLLIASLAVAADLATGAAGGQTYADPTVTDISASATTVAYGQPVTLTATVSGGDARLSTGQVAFCVSGTAQCDALFNLGVAQLNGNGVATFRIAPGTIGDHSFYANFLGRTGFAPGRSENQTVTVTGIYPSTTAITATDSGSGSLLTAEVTGLGTRILSPGGEVNFYDTTASPATSLGSAPLGFGTLGFTTARPSAANKVGSEPYGAATGDFNGDGLTDLVVQNYGDGSVSVLLGNGDGTFQPQVKYAVGALPERVLVADFNGDGNLDLVVANTGSQSIGILLGNGDGTFQAQATYACGSPVGLGVMDINHDGIQDVVAGDYYNNTISVLLGNGDGTLRAAVTYPTGSTPQTLAEGDFNGDTNVDIVVGNLNNNTVGVFLGKGDGTFQAMVTYPVGKAPQGVQVGDFNGDGVEDLAVVNSGDNTVSILIGNSDGTFQPQVTYPVGADPVGIVIADFNGDGFQDISVGNTAQSALTQSILLGSGDGTFQNQLTFPAGNFPYGEAVGDFNGDGYPDLAISNFEDGTSLILLSQVTQTATGTISTVLGSSTNPAHTVDASYPGDDNFSASVSGPLQLGGGGSTAPTIASISPAETAVSTQSLAITITGTNFVSTSFALANGTAVATTYVSATRLTATVPAGDLAAAGTLPIAVQTPVPGASALTSPSVPLTIVPDLVLSSISPTQVPLDAPATTLTVVGQNFTTTTIIQFGTTALTTTFVSATQLTATLPATLLATAASVPITTNDPASGSISTAATFTVLGTPNVVFSGPATAAPGAQPAITFQIAQAYSLPVTGVVTVAFAPAAGLPDDPTVVLADGTRTLTFTLPAGSTATPAIMLQAGTTAGVVTVSLALTSDGVPVTTVAPVVIQVPKAAPVITSLAISHGLTSVTLTIKGLSSTRELSVGGFTFTPSAENSFTQATFALPVTPIFVTWYSDPTSDQYGTAFTYTQVFELDGSSTSVQSVAVSLTNSVGASNTVSAQ